MLRVWLLLFLSLPLIKMYDIVKTNGDPFYYCMKTYNVTHKQLDLVTADIDAAIDEHKLQCYIGCVLHVTGLLQSCRLMLSSLYIKGGMETINGLERNQINAIINECEPNLKYSDDPCTCGYTFAKCVQGILEG